MTLWDGFPDRCRDVVVISPMEFIFNTKDLWRFAVPNRAGTGEREHLDHLSDFDREPWEQVKMLQISHLEFVLARIVYRVELRKASVGKVKTVRAESRSTLSTAGASRVLKVKRPLEPYWLFVRLLQ